MAEKIAYYICVSELPGGGAIFPVESGFAAILAFPRSAGTRISGNGQDARGRHTSFRKRINANVRYSCCEPIFNRTCYRDAGNRVRNHIRKQTGSDR